MEFVKRASKRFSQVVGSIPNLKAKKEPSFQTIFYLPMSSTEKKKQKRTREVLEAVLVEKGSMTLSKLEALLDFCSNPVEGKAKVDHFGQLLIPRDLLEKEFGMGLELAPAVERACNAYQLRIKREELEQRENRERKLASRISDRHHSDASQSIAAASSTDGAQARHEAAFDTGGSGYDEDSDSSASSFKSPALDKPKSAKHSSSRKSHKSKSSKSKQKVKKSPGSGVRAEDFVSSDGNESDVEDSSSDDGHAENEPKENTKRSGSTRRKKSSSKKKLKDRVTTSKKDAIDLY